MDFKSVKAELKRLQTEEEELKERLTTPMADLRKQLEPHRKEQRKLAESAQQFTYFCEHNEAVGRAIPKETVERHQARLRASIEALNKTMRDLDTEVYETYKADFDRQRAIALEIQGCQEVIKMLEAEQEEVTPIEEATPGEV